MSIFEVIMLFAFGVSWPISIYNTLKVKVVSGKSLHFMIIVCLGYLSGILHKIFYSRDWVIVLYIFNMAMVMIEILLYIHYSPKSGSAT